LELQTLAAAVVPVKRDKLAGLELVVLVDTEFVLLLLDPIIL
jgi:hypothetical protein